MPEETKKRSWVRSFEYAVTTSDETNPLVEFDLPRDAKTIKGIRIESDAIPECYNRAFVGIEISNEEVVPPLTSVQMFMFSDNADQKFLEIGDFKNDSAKMRVSIADKGLYTFNPYKIRIVILFEK